MMEELNLKTFTDLHLQTAISATSRECCTFFSLVTKDGKKRAPYCLEYLIMMVILMAVNNNENY